MFKSETPVQPTLKPTAPASLIVEEPRPPQIKKEPVAAQASQAAVEVKPSATLGSLKSIREKLAKQNNGPVFNSKPLTIEVLEAAWTEYIDILKKNKNHSSVTIFKMAQLEIKDENSFCIYTANSMQQKFIEAERSNLIEYLMTFFNNRNITYQIVISEQEKEETKTEKPLNTKEKYQLMIEQYPNIKVLRDKIRLELDY